MFTNTFPLDENTKLSVAKVSENGRKKWFPLARRSISTSRNKKVIFQILDCTSIKKSPNKQILVEVDRKSVTTSRNGELVLLDEKSAYFDRNV